MSRAWGVVVTSLLADLVIAMTVAACSDADSVSENGEAQSGITRGPEQLVYNTGWRVDQHVRLVRDVSGDRRADLVGFGNDGVYVAETTSDGLTSPTLVFSDLGNNQGWTPTSTIRTLADVNGDGRLDIVGFGPATVEVALKNAGAGYGAPTAWTSDFATQSGWNVAAHARLLGDVDGDGRADVVGINDWGVYVSRAIGLGGAISITAVSNFQFVSADNAGASPLIANRAAASWWEQFQLINNADGTVSLQAFVNGRYVTPDLANGGRLIASQPSIGPNEKFKMVPGANGTVAFQSLANNLWVSADLNLSGTLVANRPSASLWELFILSGFTPKALWLRNFSQSQNWDPAKHPRMLADVNHDGLADLVGFGEDGVYVARSNGTSFGDAVKVSDSFGYNQGWRIGPHIRMLANVNSDSYPDLVGINDDGVIVALGGPSGFSAATTWSTEFSGKSGWTAAKHVRLIADVDGDGLADVVGINDDHVYVARSTGIGFQPSVAVLDDFTLAKGWQVDKHPRVLADVDGDGQLDLVGFFDDAVYWQRLTPAPATPPDWASPTCSASGFAQPAPGYCQGPWRYTKTNRCVSQDPSCQQVCTSFKSCAKWENGVVGTMSTESTGILGPATRSCSQICTNTEGCFDATCSGTLTPPTAECGTAASNRLVQVRAAIANQVSAETTFDSMAAQDQRRAEAQAAASVTPAYVTVVSDRTVTQSGGGLRTVIRWNERLSCNLTVTTPNPVNAANDACGCGTWTNGTCEHDCGPKTTEYTEPGKLRPASVEISDQVCTTYDDLPATTTDQVQTKFDNLWTALQGPAPTTVAAETFKRALASRLKLIYELWGDQLSNQHTATDQLHRAASLYADRPNDNPACMLDVDAPATPAGCASPAVTSTRGDLIRCQRLLGTHAGEAVASVAAADCMALLTGYVGLKGQTSDAVCGGPHLRDVAARTAFKLEDKQLGVINSAPTTLGSLPRQLWLLDGWYTASKAADAAGVFPATDQQRRDTSFLLGEFWSRVRRNSNPDAALRALSNSATTDQAESALGLSAAANRAVEQSVVSALFAVPPLIQPENVALSRPPLRGLPVLALLGDALKPFVDDLDGLAIFHDIACQFRDCRTPDADTPSRNAWKLLANLEASSLVNDVAADRFPLAGWKPVLATLAGQQATLTQAAADAVTKPGGLAGAEQEADVHPLARRFWVLYKHARAFHGHYEATGSFESSAQNLLQGSLLEDDQQRVVTALRSRVNTFSGTVAEYRSGLIAALQAQLAVLDTGAQIQNLTDQRLRKATEMQQKAANIEGLRAAAEDEADAFASLNRSFADIQQSIDHGAYVQVGNTLTFSATAGDARFTSSRNLSDIAVRTIPGVVGGRMLVIQTTGSWTPTCALGAASFLKPDGLSDAKADLSRAEIGPEGYTVGWNGTTYSAQSSGHAVGYERTIGTSIRFCQGNGLAGQISGLSIEGCLYADQHLSASLNSTSSDGAESRTTAAFSTGLRLDDTPFPQAAVGSLLAVVTDPQTGVVRDIKVVHTGATSILIENASNVYFVVNDKQCGTSDTGHALNVTVRTMSSNTDVAGAALNAMIDVLAYMRQQQDAWVAQGTLLPNQATLLRQQSTVLLQSRLGAIQVAELPAPLVSLFDAFVSHEIVSTERRIEILATQRSLNLDLVDLRTIDDELAAGATRARLQSLVPQWLLRDLDHDTLRRSLIDLLSVSRDHLKPVLELWYPRSLTAFADAPEIAAMINADVDTSLITLSTTGRNFVSRLLDAYENGTFGAKPAGQQLPVVVLSFPRPGAEPSNAFWREADAARARRVWDAIEQHTIARFEITPEDIYSNNGGDAVLPCNEVVPVIKTMELYVVRPDGGSSNDTVNGVNRHFHGFAGVSQSFVTPDGPKIYELADSVWQAFELPVRYGISEAAVTTFSATPRQQRPIGLSATGVFDLDFSILDTVPQHGQFDANDAFPVTEVQLVMELDSRAVGTASRPAWINRCK